MKYSLNINQKAIIDLNLDIDIYDACILDFLNSFSHAPTTKKIFKGDVVYYWFDYNNISEEMPLLKLKKDTVYRRLKSLCDIGILEAHPDNQTLGRPFYTFTGLFLRLFIDLGFKSDPSDTNPTPLGYKSVPPTDENPNNYIIKEDKIINDKKNPDLFCDVKVEVCEIIPTELDLAVQRFSDMRKKKKSPLTPDAILLSRKKAMMLAMNDEDLAVQILDQSTLGTWTGIFPLKKQIEENNTSKVLNLIDKHAQS